MRVWGVIPVENGGRMRSFDDTAEGMFERAYLVAFRILGDRMEAQDIGQEALARAFVRWPRVEDHAEAWVSTVAANLAITVWRRRLRQGRLLTPQEESDHSENLAVARADLVTALRGLPRRQREVVVLRYLADLPEAAVGEALGCSIGTVKTHASRGLAALRQRMSPVGG